MRSNWPQGLWYMPCVLLAAVSPSSFAQQNNLDPQVLDALQAAPAAVALVATVRDWEGNVLRPGSDEWVCMPKPPQAATGPMCLDKEWQRWADAWINHKPFKAKQLGIAYMLQGDAGSSNIDPYATAPTDDNQWVVTGPHLMVLVPNEQTLDSYSTNPNTGQPWVMWKGTPYVHVMVPVH